MARELIWQVVKNKDDSLTLHFTEMGFTMKGSYELGANPDHVKFYRVLLANLVKAHADGDNITFYDWDTRPAVEKE